MSRKWYHTDAGCTVRLENLTSFLRRKGITFEVPPPKRNDPACIVRVLIVDQRQLDDVNRWLRTH